MVDDYSGKDTNLKIYFPDPIESGIKTASVSNQNGTTYNTIMDSHSTSHYLSLYDVPYDDYNLGSEWKFVVERLGSPRKINSHAVQVVSKAGNISRQILITTKLYQVMNNMTVMNVIVRLNNIPVMNARVTCDIQHSSHAEDLTHVGREELFDNGAGDPDIHKEDGVYSKYLPQATFLDSGGFLMKLLQ